MGLNNTFKMFRIGRDDTDPNKVDEFNKFYNTNKFVLKTLVRPSCFKGVTWLYFHCNFCFQPNLHVIN